METDKRDKNNSSQYKIEYVVSPEGKKIPFIRPREENLEIETS